MKANELRIGNWVNGMDNNPIQVDGNLIAFYAFEEKGNSSILETPIPITPEWLKKFGFIKKDIVWRDKSISKNCYQKSWYYVQFDEVTFFCKKSADQENIFLAHIQYVHQLQNIYFALTSEELELTTKQQPDNTTSNS